MKEVSLDPNTLTGFANVACRDLPEGWILSLEMENGSGCFVLFDPEGEGIEFDEYASVDDTLVEKGLKAVAYAAGKGTS
jgi:hypothetical protein